MIIERMIIPLNIDRIYNKTKWKKVDINQE